MNIAVCTCTTEDTPTPASGSPSSSGLMATKLNPRKSWWALALGGTPGESGTATTHSVLTDSAPSGNLQTLFMKRDLNILRYLL